jgi:hypothetical protein
MLCAGEALARVELAVITFFSQKRTFLLLFFSIAGK